MDKTQWRKSSRSVSQTSGDCVELADLSGVVGIRDSKNPRAGHLSVSREQLGLLVGKVKAGELDR